MPKGTAERLWETEPQRKTCLAEVTKRRGGKFAVDRAIFRPNQTRYRHHQRADLGTVWVKGGDKHDLISVFEQNGEIWHRIEGRAPPVGAELQCHIDQPRRKLDSRAHTAMHLFLKAMVSMGGPELATGPAVKGGGCFRLDLHAWHLNPEDLAAWLKRANQYVEQDVPIDRVHVTREVADRKLDPQPFRDADPYPGPGTTLTGVQAKGICTYPCDGTHADRTGDVGRIVMPEAHARDDGTFVIVGQLADR